MPKRPCQRNPPPRGGTPLYKPYRYVPPQRVGSLCHAVSVWQQYRFWSFWSEIGCGFEETTEVSVNVFIVSTPNESERNSKMRMSDVWRPMSDFPCPMSDTVMSDVRFLMFHVRYLMFDVWCPMSDIWCLTSDVWYQMSDVWCWCLTRMSDVWCRMSGVLCLITNVWCLMSYFRYPMFDVG